MSKRGSNPLWCLVMVGVMVTVAVVEVAVAAISAVVGGKK